MRMNKGKDQMQAMAVLFLARLATISSAGDNQICRGTLSAINSPSCLRIGLPRDKKRVGLLFACVFARPSVLLLLPVERVPAHVYFFSAKAGLVADVDRDSLCIVNDAVTRG